MSKKQNEAKNLKAISEAIDQHNRNCVFPAIEIQMNPFEIERLGWEEIRGLPVVPNEKLGTGDFRVVCARDKNAEELEDSRNLDLDAEDRTVKV